MPFLNTGTSHGEAAEYNWGESNVFIAFMDRVQNVTVSHDLFLVPVPGHCFIRHQLLKPCICCSDSSISLDVSVLWIFAISTQACPVLLVFASDTTPVAPYIREFVRQAPRLRCPTFCPLAPHNRTIAFLPTPPCFFSQIIACFGR